MTNVINDDSSRDGTSLSQLHRVLRDATKLSHHALDRHPLLAPLLTRELTVMQYGAALAALHGVYAQAEDVCLSFLDEHPGLFDYRSRRKLPALELDLAELGRTGVPSRMEFTAPQNIGALIGILYTIEGSTHGGQFIAQACGNCGVEIFQCGFSPGTGTAQAKIGRSSWPLPVTVVRLPSTRQRCPPPCRCSRRSRTILTPLTADHEPARHRPFQL